MKSESYEANWAYLSNAVANLFARWQIYRQLYGVSPDRIKLLNESAAAFFAHMQSVLLDYVILNICRLTDPISRGRDENAVLARLHEDDVVREDSILYEQVADAYRQVLSLAEPMRAHRNKRISHSDLFVAFQNSAAILPGVSRRDVNQCLEAIARYMNILHNRFDDTHTDYSRMVMNGDGDTLIVCLAQAAYFRDALRADSIDYDDFQASQWSSI